MTAGRPGRGGAWAGWDGNGDGRDGDRPGPVCLGWRCAPTRAGPDPPPVRPAAPPAPGLDPGWVTAQRRIAAIESRPARAGAAACAIAGALAGAGWLAGLAGPELAGCAGLPIAAGALASARSAWRARRRLARAITAERHRTEAIAAAQSRWLAARQREHAAAYRAWQRRTVRAGRQAGWSAVWLPAAIDRIDVAGGTLAGWSALLTTVAAPLLSGGGEVSVVDLTEGAAAGDLIGLARACGLRPLVWVLPADLPRLDLGAGLSAGALADVLALAAGAAGAGGEQPGHGDHGPAGDPAADCALLERVLGLLGPAPRMARVTAALRVLGQVGDPRTDLAAGLLSAEEVDRLTAMFGRGPERIVIERAWALESRLRRLDRLGMAPAPLPPSGLRVVALDRRAEITGNRVLGTYVIAALTHLLRQAPAGRPWRHVLCVLGAERIGGGALDRLTDACAASVTGLVLAYRAVPPAVRERLGRGNAAIAFMRLGNGDEARAAAELIGTEHRFVVGQLTDTIGTSLTDTWGSTYTSTVGTADSASDSYSLSDTRGDTRGRGRSQPAAGGPFGDLSRSLSRDVSRSLARSWSRSLSEGISAGTSWGASLSRAAGGSASAGRTAQRSREFLVEPGELQRLPPTAAIVSYPARAGREVLLVDANPAILTLPGAGRRRPADREPGPGPGEWRHETTIP